MSEPALPDVLVLADEVAAALDEGRCVVALESTIIAHGLPRPRNFEVALELEDQLRADGVTPATIAVIDGRVRIGLGRNHLEQLASDEDVAKASVRDLPVALATGEPAATTVASTAWLAHRAGIEVFATGGLGGVHRDASSSFDESADLGVLGRTPIAVVSAGIKSILDVGATLERLETLGVTVLGLGTTRFPGFYVTDSGHEVTWRIEDPSEAADVLEQVDRLGLTGAVLVANPIDEELQLDPDLHERALVDSFAAADATGLRGKDVTPFLLDHIVQATGGASLEANINAVRGNVAVAGGIANALADRRRR